ncbi:hypothetical protein Cmtc_18910 [Cupriavidus sp. TKC]|nr:hypothetical protein Cmtc_18910 [Cupriavidus sp. TKC]
MKLSGPERVYRTQLRQVAQQVGTLVNGFPPGDPTVLPTIEQLLQRYAEALTPWAERVAAEMLSEVNRRDGQAWMQQAKDMSRALRMEIRTTPTGATMQALMAEQVGLIKSIPLEAAQRVHKLTIEGIEDSSRASEISKAIQASGDVARPRTTAERTTASRRPRTSASRAPCATSTKPIASTGPTGPLTKESRTWATQSCIAWPRAFRGTSRASRKPRSSR